jgi:hypothetical protein
MLNNILSEQDLAKLTTDQREFLAQRIDHALDTDPKVREIIASKLRGIVGLVHHDIKIAK